MRTLLIATTLAVTALLLSPAVALDHVTYDHKEKDHCGPPSCGATQCYDKKNKLWLCKADKPGSCVWHQNGACLNKYKDKRYKEGDDVTGKFPPGE